MIAKSSGVKVCVGCGARHDGPLSRCKPCRGVAVAAMRRERGENGQDAAPPAPARPAEPQKATGPTLTDILSAINGMRQDMASLAARLTHIETRIGTVAATGAESARSVESIRAALRVMVERMPMGPSPQGPVASPGAAGEIPARPKCPPAGEDPASRLGVETSRQLDLD